jgi:hypothetical protein
MSTAQRPILKAGARLAPPLGASGACSQQQRVLAGLSVSIERRALNIRRHRGRFHFACLLVVPDVDSHHEPASKSVGHCRSVVPDLASLHADLAIITMALGAGAMRGVPFLCEEITPPRRRFRDPAWLSPVTETGKKAGL